MSHHSDGQGPKVTDETIEKFLLRGQDIKAGRTINPGRHTNLGPTGKFPHGKLTDDDAGQIQFSVGRKDDRVIMDFGTPVKWIGMTADDAREVGRALIKHAKKINKT